MKMKIKKIDEIKTKFIDEENNDLQEAMDEIFDTPEIRFFAGLYPFELLSKNREEYPNAIEPYPPNLIISKRGRHRWVFKALMDYISGHSFYKSKIKQKWKKGDIIFLPPGLMFKHISSRYYGSKNPISIKIIKEYGKNG